MLAVPILTLADHETYNKLLPLLDANTAVHRAGLLDTVLAEAARIFVRHRLNEHLGVSLLHKHADIPADTEMFQREAMIDGRPVLICEPTVKDAYAPGAFPYLFGFVDNECIGLEHCDDPVARQGYQAVTAHPQFLGELWRLLESHGAQHLLGLIVLNRSMFREVREELVIVEETVNRANVLSVRQKTDFETSSLVQTAWSFSSPMQLKCVVNCVWWCMPGPNHINQHRPEHRMQAASHDHVMAGCLSAMGR